MKTVSLSSPKQNSMPAGSDNGEMMYEKETGFNNNYLYGNAWQYVFLRVIDKNNKSPVFV